MQNLNNILNLNVFQNFLFLIKDRVLKLSSSDLSDSKKGRATARILYTRDKRIFIILVYRY